ncbi:DUF4139 domain-containing protein [Puniceicoccus vermicola]|uniref:DUF4139 domain-containing protein n=1 Tax=Puniceicoccus vermicola TaxID=388746 RepID=A0A7X1AXR5_9BACT|nr:DUF4139 domain-containing protein [Puniceicoccus vermicola]MBC2601906.1 hypothetical protein [Puniceicoccus vermicola]
MIRKTIPTLLAGLATLSPLTAQTGLTIYNENFAVIRDQVSLDLAGGTEEVSYSGVTSQLEPQSVVLRDQSGKVNLRVLEQSYRGDPVNQERLLQMFEGETIQFVHTLGDSEVAVDGKIVRAPTRSSSGYLEPIIEVDGQLLMQLPGDPRFPSLGDGSILQPTLSWKIYSADPVSLTADLSYLTGGLSWESDYNLILQEEGDEVSMSGWVSVQNRSGKNFEKATINLIAGNVNKVIENDGGAAKNEIVSRSFVAAAPPPSVEEKKFDEFHLYSLPGEIDLRDQETKQLEFVRADPVATTKTYVYNGSALPNYWRNNGGAIDNPGFGQGNQTKVSIFRSFKNSEENNLGIPLPAGTVRFYRADTDGQIEFIGENTIDHTPKDETVKLYIGDAFDLVGERKQVDFFRHRTQDLIRETFSIEIRNRSEEEVTVQVVEPLYRWNNWEILSSNIDYKKIDSRTIEFPVTVAAGKTQTVNYTVEYTW